MKNILGKSGFTILLLTTAVVAFAQGPPGPPATPIDGGLSLLLAGGAAYGIKKIRDYKKVKD